MAVTHSPFVIFRDFPIGRFGPFQPHSRNTRRSAKQVFDKNIWPYNRRIDSLSWKGLGNGSGSRRPSQVLSIGVAESGTNRGAQ